MGIITYQPSLFDLSGPAPVAPQTLRYQVGQKVLGTHYEHMSRRWIEQTWEVEVGLSTGRYLCRRVDAGMPDWVETTPPNLPTITPESWHRSLWVQFCGPCKQWFSEDKLKEV